MALVGAGDREHRIDVITCIEFCIFFTFFLAILDTLFMLCHRNLKRQKTAFFHHGGDGGAVWPGYGYSRSVIC